MKSGNLNFLEPSGPLQACNGTALRLHSDQNAVTITRAGQLRQTRNLAIKDNSEAMKVFNSGKTGGKGDQCKPKLSWLDSRNRTTYMLKANNLLQTTFEGSP
jgi:hypothetical protein